MLCVRTGEWEAPGDHALPTPGPVAFVVGVESCALGIQRIYIWLTRV